MCKLCNDSGIDGYTVDPATGETIYIDCECGIREQRRQARHIRALGNELGDSLSDKTFENFDLNRPVAPFEWNGDQVSLESQQYFLEDSFEKARAYAEDPRGWLFIYGEFGSGKSHLAAAVGHVIAKRGLQVSYRNVPELMDMLRAGMNDGKFAEISDAVRNSKVLVLDDIGAENTTGWTEERLFIVLDHRMRYKMPTIMTANFHWDKYPGRISDRIAGMSIPAWLPVGSYRRLQAGAR